ncbi:MAG: hypothetical protein ACXV78_14780 [Candidatus Angelobacter sp.]
MPTDVAPLEKRLKAKTPVTKQGWILLAVSICAVVLLGLLAAKWPFTREAMTLRLERASSARVEMRGFRSTYFPYPGCVADEVVFRPKTSARGNRPPNPIITIHKLTIESTISGLLSKPWRIKRIIADGLRVQIPPSCAGVFAFVVTTGKGRTRADASCGVQDGVIQLNANLNHRVRFIGIVLGQQLRSAGPKGALDSSQDCAILVHLPGNVKQCKQNA